MNLVSVIQIIGRALLDPRFWLNAGKYLALIRAAEGVVKAIKTGGDWKRAFDIFLSVVEDLLIAGAVKSVAGIQPDEVAKTIKEVRGQLS